MSNMIPIVSSSPPPFDDSCGWDDGEDDFGSFTSADDQHKDSPDILDKSQNSDVENKNCNGLSCQKISKTTVDDIDSCNKHSTNDSYQQTNSTKENLDTITNGNGDFAHIDSEDTSNPVRPQIAALPLSKINEARDRTDCELNDNETNREPYDETVTLGEGKEQNKSCSVSMRDSTTDSGMFSNDISPVQKSEDTAEFCDKTGCSDTDEPFPDLSPDGKVEATISQTQQGDNQMSSPEVSKSLHGDEKEFSDESDKMRTNSFDSISEGSLNTVGLSILSGCDETITTKENSSFRDESEGDEWGQLSVSESGIPQTSENLGLVDDSCEPCDDVCKSDGSDNQIFISTEETVTTVCEAEGNSENENICDYNVLPHSTNKDLQNSINLQTIPSKTDLSQDSVTIPCSDADNEQNQESADNTYIQNQEPVPAQNVDSSQRCSNQDSDSADTSNDTTIYLDTETQHQSDNVQSAEKQKSPIKDISIADEECSDNLFDNFEGNEECIDDWTGFRTSGHLDQPLDLPSISQDFDGDNNDEDFGDFIDNAVVKENVIHGSTRSEDSVSDPNQDNLEKFNGSGDGDWANNDDDWANFEEAHDDNDDGDDGDDGEFGQFESKPVPEATAVKTPQYKDIGERLTGVMDGCFLAPVINENDEVNSIKSDVLQAIISCDTEKNKPQWSQKPETADFIRKIWGKLVDLDKTPALDYQWTSSRGNSFMFKTLHIDTQNILLSQNKRSVPIFASNISLLEPIRGPVDTKKDFTKNEPTLVDPNKVDIPPSENQDIPPVEFDWHNSGLTNPLAAKTLDLDFLTEQESESAGRSSDEWDWVFQSEVLDTQRSSVKSLPPLEDVLKNMKLTSTTQNRTKKEEILNPEARRIIDSLPLLSFMHAKVLMFPFRQQED